jgi:biopolymer transport protein ExbB
MMYYMQSGGIIMWFIAGLSVIAFAVVAERLIFFHKAWTDPEKLEEKVAVSLSNGDIEGAKTTAVGSGSSLNRLFAAALDNWGIGREDMKELAEQQVRREVYRWQKHLSILEVIGKTAPLLGLLGTVLGMVEMFSSLHAGGEISAAAVTGGIWKALFTTVAGLIVAIPTIFMHGYLVSKIDSAEETLNRGADFLIRARFAKENPAQEN